MLQTAFQAFQHLRRHARALKSFLTPDLDQPPHVNSSSGPSIVPVAFYSACEIPWHIVEQPVLAVRGVVLAAYIVPVFSVAAIVPVFPAGTYPVQQRDRLLLKLQADIENTADGSFSNDLSVSAKTRARCSSGFLRQHSDPRVYSPCG